MGKPVQRFHPEALDLLKSYDWPGNVRQLENTIERSVAMESREELHVNVPTEGMKSAKSAGIPIPKEGVDFEAYVAAVEKSLIQSALRREKNVQTHAAGFAEAVLPFIPPPVEEARHRPGNRGGTQRQRWKNWIIW